MFCNIYLADLHHDQSKVFLSGHMEQDCRQRITECFWVEDTLEMIKSNC